MIFDQEVLVRGQEVSQDKLITNKALIELFSNITMLHGYTAGHTSVQGTSPVSWIVLEWNMQVYRRVRMFEKIRVATWIHSYNRVRADREYVIFDENGDPTVKACAQWAALDGQKGTFLRLNPALMDPYGQEEQCNFPDYKYPPFKIPEEPVLKSGDFLVYHQMIDYNGHLHNSEYLNLADQIWPEDVLRVPVDHVEIIYKKQVLPNETVKLEYSCAGNAHTAAVRNIETGELCALVILGRE